MQIQPFNPGAQQPSYAEGGVKLTVGKWPMQIVASEAKQVKDNASAGYLEFTCVLLDGPEKGLSQAYRINLYSDKQDTAAIAARQLTSLCMVCGVFQTLTDTQQLHNKPFIGVVTPQRNDPERTQISGVTDMNGNDPGKAAQGVGAASAPPQQQQPAQQAWGGGQQPAQQPQQAAQQVQQPAATGWGGGQPAQQPQAQQPAAGGTPWGGGAPAGQPAAGTPPWGVR